MDYLEQLKTELNKKEINWENIKRIEELYKQQDIIITNARLNYIKCMKNLDDYEYRSKKGYNVRIYKFEQTKYDFISYGRIVFSKHFELFSIISDLTGNRIVCKLLKDAQFSIRDKKYLIVSTHMMVAEILNMPPDESLKDSEQYMKVVPVVYALKFINEQMANDCKRIIKLFS